MSVLVPDKVNIPFLAAVPIGIAEHLFHMMIPDDPAYTLAGQLRDGIACQLAGLLIAVDNVTLQIQ
ncbi:hypothetical protein D3C74_432930 [compost metagenome]